MLLNLVNIIVVRGLPMPPVPCQIPRKALGGWGVSLQRARFGEDLAAVDFEGDAVDDGAVLGAHGLTSAPAVKSLGRDVALADDSVSELVVGRRLWIDFLDEFFHFMRICLLCSFFALHL